MQKDFKDSNEYELPRWGFYLFSEILNGRVAMLALPIITLIEFFTKKTLLGLILYFQY